MKILKLFLALFIPAAAFAAGYENIFDAYDLPLKYSRFLERNSPQYLGLDKNNEEQLKKNIDKVSKSGILEFDGLYGANSWEEHIFIYNDSGFLTILRAFLEPVKQHGLQEDYCSKILKPIADVYARRFARIDESISKFKKEQPSRFINDTEEKSFEEMLLGLQEIRRINLEDEAYNALIRALDENKCKEAPQLPDR